MTKISNISGKIDLAIYCAIAFPFLLQLVPGVDTQPTFAVLIVTVFLLIRPIRVEMLTELSRFHLQSFVIFFLILGLLVAILVNEALLKSTQRIFSFLIFLVALIYGVSKPQIITAGRLRNTLLVYCIFTIIYFLTEGAIESTLFSSRGEEIRTYISGGRGASTLSPEPSFFAIQVASLFVLLFLTHAPNSNGVIIVPKSIFVFGIGLLLASLSGYGALYAMALTCVLSHRFTIVVLGFVVIFIALFSDIFDVRVIRLINLAQQEGFVGVLVDASIGERLRSFTEYVGIFLNTAVGNAFQNLDGGGLVSVLAGLGLFSLPFFFLLLIGLIRFPVSIFAKGVIALWVALTTISGPIGVPIVGIIVGQILRQVTLVTRPVLVDVR
jgi:hypothetical protein